MDYKNRQSHDPAEQEGRFSRFESDTKKLTRRHLSDPQHVITEEEMKSIRIGMAPPTHFPSRAIPGNDK